ncbi:MAG: diacylglycerol kinase family protein [Planctomycetota bacterium]
MTDLPADIDRFSIPERCRVLVFTSPNAGSGKGRDQIPRFVELLQQSGVDARVTHQVNELQELSAVPPDSQVIIVPAGGDGTLSLASAAVSKSIDSDGNLPLIAPLPLGTENLLARHFGHTSRAEELIQTIRFGSCYRLDAGTANESPFLIMASCGFDAEVVRGMHLTRSGHIQRLSYFGPIMRAMRHYPFPELEVRIDNGDTLECRWAMVFNLPCYGGGLKIEPNAIGNDGLFDVILFRKGSIPSGIGYVTSIWTGTHLKRQDVVRLRGRRVEIRSSGRVPYQLDGDYAGKIPLRIEMHPGFVQLLVPSKQAAVA